MAIREDLIKQYTDLALATARLMDIQLNDKSLASMIERGVDNLLTKGTGVSLTSVGDGAVNLSRIIVEMRREQDAVGQGLQRIDLIDSTKSWKKLCPGCPPWC